MKALFDTNVILDVLLCREPHAGLSAQAVAAVERKQVEGLLAATAITTLHYNASRTLGRDPARQAIAKLLGVFGVAPINQQVLQAALLLPFSDYEDAVLYEAARRSGAVAIVTRDRNGFTGGTLAVLSPEELLQTLGTLT